MIFSITLEIVGRREIGLSFLKVALLLLPSSGLMFVSSK